MRPDLLLAALAGILLPWAWGRLGNRLLGGAGRHWHAAETEAECGRLKELSEAQAREMASLRLLAITPDDPLPSPEYTREQVQALEVLRAKKRDVQAIQHSLSLPGTFTGCPEHGGNDDLQIMEPRPQKFMPIRSGSLSDARGIAASHLGARFIPGTLHRTGPESFSVGAYARDTECPECLRRRFKAATREMWLL